MKKGASIKGEKKKGYHCEMGEENPHLSSGLDFLVPSVPTSLRESATDPPSVGQFHSAKRPKSRKIGSGRKNILFYKKT